MKRGRLSPLQVKLHYSYRVSDIVRLHGVHKNTVRAWRDAGLKPIDGSRPEMFHATDLREFLDARRKAKRVHCGPGTCYCLKCRSPRRPAGDMAEFVEQGAGYGNIRAFCPDCGTWMYRRAARHRLAIVMPSIDITFVQPEQRLTDRSDAS